MRRHTGCALFASLLVAAGPAAAHGASKSLGNFFGGFVHPLLEPAHLLGVVAFGLAVGQRGMDRTHPAELCFCGALALGAAAAGFGVAWAGADALLLGMVVLLGLLTASALPVHRALVAAGGIVTGLCIGLGSRPDAVQGSALFAALAGTALGGSVWMVNMAALVGALKRPWMRIGVRIAGSWATASALLVLAFWLARPAPPAQVSLMDQSVSGSSSSMR